MIASSNGNRLHALDGLRGLCACLVMLYHMEFLTAGLASWTFFRHSFLFVDFFFTLSGFVITRSACAKLATDLRLRSWLSTRVATIYPLYLAMLLAIPAINLAAMIAGLRPQIGGASGIEDAGTWIASAIMLQGLLLYSPLIWNVPGWSVAAEMLTYLIAGGLMRFGGRVLPWLMAMLWAGSLTILLATTPTIEVFDGRGLARCLWGFSTGYFAFRTHTRLRSTMDGVRAGNATAIEIVVIASVIAFVILAAKTRWSLAAPLPFAVAILLLAQGRGTVSAGLSVRPLTKIGDWSYALYICHFPIEMRLVKPLAARLLPQGWLADPWMASLLAVAIGALCIAVAAVLTGRVQAPLRGPTESALKTILMPRARNSSRTRFAHLDPALDRANLASVATGERVAG